MRGRELIALKLPQMVEAQRRELEAEDHHHQQMSPVSPASIGHTSNQASQSSTISNMSLGSPSTPSGSIWSYPIVPSSTSSLPSSPMVRESLEGYGSSKRPLTDLKEEMEDRDEDVEMVNGLQEEGGQQHHHYHQPLESEVMYPQRISNTEWTFDDPQDDRFPEYDPADESDFCTAPKRQRSETSPLNGIAAKIGAIKPSLSRKWKSRKPSPIIAVPGLSREPSLSRANSTRAPSISSVTAEANNNNSNNNNKPSHATYPLPPTPTRSTREEPIDDPHSPFFDTTDLSSSHIIDEEEDLLDQAKPTTPLLPPIMTAIPDHIKEVPYQSPLQSPAIADPKHNSLYDSPLPTPQITSLPSPPLSSRPSIGSFRSRNPSTSIRTGLGITQSPLIPSSEIPPNPLDPVSSTSDPWSNVLGHANFTIEPEPYLPVSPVTASACNKLRSDWEAARFAYAKHLSRTGEHHGTTSKTYRLTIEKWAEVDAEWMRNIDTAVATAIPSSPIFSPALSEVEAKVTKVEPKPHPPLIKMPSLSDGKFPELGDEGIVGPMEVVKSPLQIRLEELQEQQEREGLKRKRKWGVFKWVQGVCAGIGSGGSSSKNGGIRLNSP